MHTDRNNSNIDSKLIKLKVSNCAIIFSKEHVPKAIVVNSRMVSLSTKKARLPIFNRDQDPHHLFKAVKVVNHSK
jgi:hypothetical protein